MTQPCLVQRFKMFECGLDRGLYMAQETHPLSLYSSSTMRMRFPLAIMGQYSDLYKSIITSPYLLIYQ